MTRFAMFMTRLTMFISRGMTMPRSRRQQSSSERSAWFACPSSHAQVTLWPCPVRPKRGRKAAAAPAADTLEQRMLDGFSAIQPSRIRVPARPRAKRSGKVFLHVGSLFSCCPAVQLPQIPTPLLFVKTVVRALTETPNKRDPQSRPISSGIVVPAPH